MTPEARTPKSSNCSTIKSRVKYRVSGKSVRHRIADKSVRYRGQKAVSIEPPPIILGNNLTYYAPLAGSFGTVSGHHMRLLPTVNWTVRHVLLSQMLKTSMGTGDWWGLVHPIFYIFQERRRAIQRLRRGHGHIGGFDLADTDKISPFASTTANEIDLIMVPSECSKETFIRSGVKTRVEVVPHGVNEELYSSPKGHLHLIPRDGVKILFFFLHSELRKGADIVRVVMKRILSERPDVRFILKTGAMNDLCNLPRTTWITQWLSELDLIRLYDACDIVFAPSRGGGFEINVLEGLARGKVVVTSDWPAIQEYAARYAITIESDGTKVKPLSGNPIHIGYGANPHVNQSYELMNYALDNLEYLKKKAEKYAPEIRKKYSWKKTARRIAECLD